MALRRLRISLFVVVWLLVFLYETFRYGYLSPLAGRPLPKLPLLFPPAGWIMFFNVDSSYGFAEVYGLRSPDHRGRGGVPDAVGGRRSPDHRGRGGVAERQRVRHSATPSVAPPDAVGSRLGGQPVLIDPHEIFETRAVGYDNIHRNVLVTVLYRERADAFCRYLRRKFPAYESFAVVYGDYPDLISLPDRINRQVLYRCE